MSKADLFINGSWQAGEGAEMRSISPIDGQVIWQGAEASAAQVNDAVMSAKNAFKGWSEASLDQRINYLEEFAEELDAQSNDIAKLISEDTGKTLWDAKGEVTAAIGKIAISIKAYIERTGQVVNDSGVVRSKLVHRPHGVMCIFGPYNFPLHLPNGHMIPALLAGNTVVYKPSELTPKVAKHVAEIWQDIGLPKGVLNLVQGGGTVGQALVANPNINGVLFTGSVPTGKAISKALAERLDVITALELGGNNPLIVGKVADLEAAALLTVQSAFISSGQRCTCARRLIVPTGKQGDKFVDTLAKIIDKIEVGRPFDAGQPFLGPITMAQDQPFMGPLINEAAALNVIKTQQDLKNAGGKVIRSAEVLPQGKAYVSPGLIDVTNVIDRPDEECFGPLLQVIRVANLDAAIAEANNTRFGLAAGLLSDDRAEYDQFSSGIRAGIVNWNKQLTGASSAAPFGGIGDSGNHRPSAYYAADYCAYPVASLEDAENCLTKQELPMGIKL